MTFLANQFNTAMNFTKSYFLLIASFTISTCSFAQMKIGDNASTIDNASILELESTTKALVLTRVTTAQMNEINPLNGALIYNTDAQCVFQYNGTSWQNLCNTTSGSLSIIDNEDGSFTINGPDGTNFTSPNFTELRGEQGLPGNDGLGISSTTDNNDGTITITYTDNSTLQLLTLTVRMEQVHTKLR
ncbi:hypothetical protein Q2T41_11105 [Maribacter confluentis]|uniref:Lipocalin-like domain-containing protein n=2 Tax=Maribacter confluentis TaxID=1656093 RepID=A0ABT8RQQ2_9FLAO|nr:hypothetical protein [Maribacter confluentis]MDO1513204.1 hypothetical protein [Maribacter confluentis]